MKRIIVITTTLLVLALINYIPTIEPASSASTLRPMQEPIPDPVRQLPGLESLTFHIQNGIFGGPTPFTFAVGSAQLIQRRADPLSISNNDFVGLEAFEFDDVFYSDSDGTLNPDGRFVTIESVYSLSNNAGLRLAEVQLNFAGGRVENFNQVASFVRFGGVAGTERFAADGNLQTNAQLGNTIGQSGRLRLTLGFLAPTACTYSIQPTNQSFPGFLEIGFASATFAVTAPAGCQWNVEADTTEPNFISVVSPIPVSGSRSVSYQVFTNPGATPRTGRIHVRDVQSGEIRQTLTINQDGFNCPGSGYSVSPSNVVIERSGDSFSFEAKGPPGCMPGLPSIDVDWIRFVTSVEITGESRRICFFDVRSNPGAFRTGTIDVSGQRFFVYQNPQGCPIELICAFFPGVCGVDPEPAGEIRDAGTLELSRKFRDLKLAGTPRGQKYIRLYYQFGPDAVQAMMFNPMLMLRSREALERYKPVVEAMVNGEPVTLTSRDVEEIDGLLNSFASRGSAELQEAINGVREDLRDPGALSEFGISMTEGPMRPLPPQGQLQSFIRNGSFTVFFGFSLVFVYRIGRRQRKNLKRLMVVGIAGPILIGNGAIARVQLPPAGGEPICITAFDQVSNQPNQRQTSRNQSSLPITFEANHGQADAQVKFISRAAGYNLYLSGNEAVISLRGQKSEPAQLATELRTELRMKLIGANAEPQSSGEDPETGRTNYFIGNDPAGWRTGLPVYTRVRFERVYPGVDMLYYGNNGELEYDFVVAPGADPRAIRLGFEGSDLIEVDDWGDLVLHTAVGELRHRKPRVYQEKNGGRREIAARYVLTERENRNHTGDEVISPAANGHREEHLTAHSSFVSFEIGEYERELPLIIDPVFSYSTYLGGSGTDEGNAVAVDEAGNTYIAGFTDSLNFPTANPSQAVFGGGQQDAFVAKLDTSGRLIYSTYLGGDGQDNATSIAVDSSGNAWLAGFTASTDFPVRNAFQPARAGLFNAVVVRLDERGSLLTSTHLGGRISDHASSIVIDASGNVYVGGVTTSPNFPLANALQAAFGGSADLFVAKFNPSGRQLVFSTYLGGAGIDAASSMAVDETGNVYLTGLTSSPDLRTANALQATHRGGLFDAFVAKLSPSGNQLIYSTYLGGSSEDRGLRIAVDRAGNAFITGDTESVNFPAANALQASAGGGGDAFVAKLNPTGNQLVYSTYLGGSGMEGGTGIAVDSAGSAAVTGFTSSTNFPVVRALQQSFGGGTFDGFVAKLGATGAALDYATYLGGAGVDAGFGIAVDGAGIAYVIGQTDSTNFPTANALQPVNGGGTADLFVARIKPGPSISSIEIEGKHLIVTGGGFERGAVISLNGEDQKTKFQSSTSLRGKKAGKKIAPGQTVRIQVRNADGLTSGEFSFRRDG